MSSNNQHVEEKDETATLNRNFNVYQNDVVAQLLNKMAKDMDDLERAARFHGVKSGCSFMAFTGDAKDTLETCARFALQDARAREAALQQAQEKVSLVEAKKARVVEKIQDIHAKMAPGTKKDEKLIYALAKLKEKEKALRKALKEQRKEMKKVADEWSN